MTAPRKTVTILDIARQCGFSKTTVHQALTQGTEVNAATAEKIQQIAREMGYNPDIHMAARRMVAARRKTPLLNRAIGVSFPPEFARAPYFARIFSGLFETLAQHSFNLLCFHPAALLEGTLPSLIQRGDIDGLITHGALRQSTLSQLHASPGFGTRPLVELITHSPTNHAVVADDVQGGYLAAAHLLDLGHRRILYFHDGPSAPHNTTNWCRYQGYLKACQERNLQPETIFYPADRYQGPFNGHDRMIDAQVRSALKQDPTITAILAHNDDYVIHIERTLHRLGLRVPHDMSLIGFDDTHVLLNEKKDNILTTIHVPLYELGCDTAHLMLELVSDHTIERQTRILPVSLVVRGSTAPLSR